MLQDPEMGLFWYTKVYDSVIDMNNWYVITGAPSSGKTTIIDALSARGYKTYPETAREYIDAEMEKGKTIEQIRSDEKNFQLEIYKLKISREERLNRQDTIIFDRGIPDTLAYMKLGSIPFSKDSEKVILGATYRKVFLLEPLPFEYDYARTEDAVLAIRLDKLLEEAYVASGNSLIKVPKATVEERLKLIVSNISEPS